MKKETGKNRRAKRGETYGRQRSKGKTFNVQRPTSNVQRKLKEEQGESYGRRSKGRTFNVQRSTLNVQFTVNEEPSESYGRSAKVAGSSDKRYDLEDRLLEYAVRIVRLVDALPRTPAGRHMADQLLRCGTSPLANHGEVQGAESRKDFIHTLRICFKEMRESRRWLRLIHRVPLLNPAKVEPLLRETEELIKIFSASIKTAEKNKK